MTEIEIKVLSGMIFEKQQQKSETNKSEQNYG